MYLLKLLPEVVCLINLHPFNSIALPHFIIGVTCKIFEEFLRLLQLRNLFGGKMDDAPTNVSVIIPGFSFLVDGNVNVANTGIVEVGIGKKINPFFVIYI